MATAIAGNEPWLTSLLSVAENYTANVDVIDHYEFLATLDSVTCDECAALDG